MSNDNSSVSTSAHSATSESAEVGNSAALKLPTKEHVSMESGMDSRYLRVRSVAAIIATRISIYLLRLPPW